MTVCNRCGKENQDHYKFCLGCGAELTAAPKPGGPGGDVAMMKTMMEDPSQPSPIVGAPLRGPSAAMPQPGAPGGPRPTGGGMPGMPPRARSVVRRCPRRWARRPAFPGSRPARPACRPAPAARPPGCAAARRAAATSRRRSGSAAPAASAWTRARRPRRCRCPPGPAVGAPGERAAPHVDDADPSRRHRGRHPRSAPGREQARPQLRPGVRERRLPVARSTRSSTCAATRAVVRDLDSLNGVFVKMTRRGGADLRPDPPHRPGAAALRAHRRARADRRRHRAHGQPEPGLLGQADRDHRPRHHRLGVPAARRERARSAASAARSTSPTTATSRACTRASRCATAACTCADLGQLERHVRQGQRRARRRPRVVRAARPAAVPAQPRVAPRRGPARPPRRRLLLRLADVEVLRRSGPCRSSR